MRILPRWCWCAGLVLAVSGWAAEFSQGLSADEYAAAGLNKLTPEELARLDELVRARAEHAAMAAPAAAPAPAPDVSPAAAPAPKSGGMLHRLQAAVSPGGDNEQMESQISGGFRGYQPGTVLTLANGQKWRVVDGSYWAPAKDAARIRHVTVKSGSFGSFFMSIEDAGRPRVKLVSLPQ